MRILLVEDEPDVRMFFARALTHICSSIEVVQAADGQEGLDLFHRVPVELILSDQRMPRLTGLQMLRAVRVYSDIPFFLITADRSIHTEAYLAGVTELLTKPISLAALRAAVTRFVHC